MSTFLVRYNGTIIDTAPMYLYPRSQFGTVPPNEDANNTVVKLTIIGVATGAPIRTPSDEEMDTLPIYEIPSPLFWDPSSKFHAEN